MHTPTLTGLAERKNLLTPEVGLQTHVDDIVALFETEDLSEVHLVGWSYGGVVITGALARVHARVRAATFLDAFVLEDGESVSDRLSERMRRGVIAMEQKGLPLAPPDPAEAWGVRDEELLAYARPLMSEQPIRTLTEPVRALPDWPEHITYTYVRCRGSQSENFDAFLKTASLDSRFETIVVDEGHAIPLTHPKRVVELLDP